VLSLAAFLLGYDAVCGDRRQGTLKLALTYPAPRWKLLAGKFLALWACLAAPFLAGAALSLALAAGPGGIPFAAGDLAKAGLVALLGLWAAAFFVLAALLVSSLTREPSASLSVLVWIWVTAVLVVPAASGLLAHRLHPLPTDAEIARETAGIQRRIARDYAGLEGRWRQPAWAAADGFAWEKASAEAENRRFALREELRRRVLRSKLDQARLARGLSSLSPGALATDIAERLTGSGLWRDESFLEQAWAFRSALAGRMRALDARDPESPHVLFFTGWVSARQVPPGEVPRFSFRERPALAGLAGARPALALFALETLLLAAAALFTFSRYDAG
jgi:ABC-2 type transport system permease protein